MLNRDNPEIARQAAYVRGLADALQLGGVSAPLLRASVETLEKTAGRTCGQGILGCYGGPTCTSDHK